MPQPTASDVLVSVPLSNVSIAYMQNAGDSFIADKVFPNVPVDKQAGLYLTYDRNAWLRDEATERAPGTPSEGGGWDVDFTANYYARVYAYHKDVDDQIRANGRGFMDLDRDATEFVTRKMLIKREVIWATNNFTTGKWSTDLAGVASGPGAGQFVKWSVAGSTPIEDIQGQIIAVAGTTGFRPNTLVLTPDVFNIIRSHAEVLDRIKYTQRGTITEELLASLLGVDRVLVPYGIKATNKEGGTAAYAFVLGTKSALLCYAAPNPGLMTPSAGYTFSWTGYLGAGVQGARIKSFRMDELSSDRVEGEIAFDSKVVAPDLGVFFSAAIA